MLTNDWPTLDVLRLRYIARVIERNGGNKTRAAEMLGIDRRTLNRILSRERAKQAAAARFRPLNVVLLPSKPGSVPPPAGVPAATMGADPPAPPAATPGG